MDRRSDHLEVDGISARFSPSSKPTQRPLRFTTSVIGRDHKASCRRETTDEAEQKCTPACFVPGRPVNTRGPSGNMTISPRRNVLSARSSGTGSVISPGALGLVGCLLTGASTRATVARALGLIGVFTLVPSAPLSFG